MSSQECIRDLFANWYMDSIQILLNLGAFQQRSRKLGKIVNKTETASTAQGLRVKLQIYINPGSSISGLAQWAGLAVFIPKPKTEPRLRQ